MEIVEKRKIVPDEAIEFTFFVNNLEIAVLNNKMLGVEEGVLLLGKIVFDGKDHILESLDEEEDKIARKGYYRLVKLSEESDNE